MDALTITSAVSVPRRLDADDPVAPARASMREPLTATVLTEAADIAGILPQWQALEEAVGQPVFFQSAAWCSQVIESCEDGGLTISPWIVCVRQGRDLVGVWPLRLMQHMGARLLADLTDPFGQYADALIAPDADVSAVCEEMLQAIRHQGGVDGLLLRKVRADAAIAPFLVAKARQAGGSERAPAVSLAEHATYADLLKSINPKTRKNLRNSRNRLARVGEVVHEVITDPEERRRVIDRAFGLRLELLEEEGHTSRAYNDPAFRRLVAHVAGDASGGLELLVMRLSIGGQDLAIQWGFVHNGRYYAYVAARSTLHEDASPGRLHLAHVIETCKARGLAVADLLAPAAPYKLCWTSESMQIADWSLPLTWRGRIVLDLWNRRLRPASRRVLLGLPLVLRRPLVRLMRRAG